VGRIDPAPSARGIGARAKVLLGIAAALAIAIGAYELGRSDSAPPPPPAASRVTAAPAARAAPPKEAVRASPVAKSTDELLAEFDRAHPTPVQERADVPVTAARPEPAATAAASPPRPEVTDLPETPRNKMARCLTFRVETDEVHVGGYSPLLVQVKVTASNACSFSFEGPDVSIEVRAMPLHGEGTIAQAIAQFQDPIPSRGTSETEVALACPRCDEVTHRFEAHLRP
jgi:hypothetical protein